MKNGSHGTVHSEVLYSSEAVHISYSSDTFVNTSCSISIYDMFSGDNIWYSEPCF